MYAVNVYAPNTLSPDQDLVIEAEIEEACGRTWDQTDDLGNQTRYRIRCRTAAEAEQIAAELWRLVPMTTVQVEFAANN